MSSHVLSFVRNQTTDIYGDEAALHVGSSGGVVGNGMDGSGVIDEIVSKR